MSANGCPGIGGSLGQCAFCGGSFVVEVMLGRPVETFCITQVEGSLYAHPKCMEQHGAKKSILDWPEASPVRRAIERHNAVIDEQPPTLPLKGGGE